MTLSEFKELAMHSGASYTWESQPVAVFNGPRETIEYSLTQDQLQSALALNVAVRFATIMGMVGIN